MSTSQSWWWVVAAVVVLAAAWAYTVVSSRQDEQLRRSGLQATARIVSASQTGRWRGNNPVVELQLEISHPDGRIYVHPLERGIPVIHAAAIQPGKVVRVRIDPQDSGRVTIDEPWSAEGR